MKTNSIFNLGALAIVGASLVLASAAQAGYSTDFAVGDYDTNFSLSGQAGWETDDTAQPDYVGDFGDYSTPTNYVGLLGGYVADQYGDPQTALTNLYHDAELIGSDFYNGQLAQVTTKLAVIPSDITRPNRDTFGVSFLDANGTTIASIDLVPDAGDSSIVNIKWSDANGQHDPAVVWELAYNSNYNFSLAIDLNLGTIDIYVRDDTGGPNQNVYQGLFVAGGTGPVESVSYFWSLADTTAVGTDYTQFGANSLVISDVTVVPEPSTYALIALSGLALLAYRARRRHSVLA